MSFQRSLLHTVLMISCSFAATSVAANTTNPFTARLEQQTTQAQQLQEEYEFTLYKRKSTEDKLNQLKSDLRARQGQLATMKAALDPEATREQKEAVDNEAQRIALAELSIKSQEASLNRLMRKEREIQEALEATHSSISATEKAIAAANAKAQAEARARDQAIQKELENLRLENDRLRLAMEEEARRTKAAEEAARRVAELAKQEEQDRLEVERLAAQEAAFANATTTPTATQVTSTAAQITQATAAQQASSRNSRSRKEEAPDLSQVVLDDEPPIYQDNDTIRVTIRSRSIDRPVIMTQVAPRVYRAEFTVEPGRAFFDVRNRRYRGYFPESAGGKPYVFYYDLSGEKPVMSVRTKANDDQIISNAKEAF